MIFHVERTSGNSDTEAPCAGAVRRKVAGEYVWKIDVKDLEELLDIADKACTYLVIKPETVPVIELYNDYRE